MATEKQLAALAKARASRKPRGDYQERDEVDAKTRTAPPVRDEKPDMTPEQLAERAADFSAASLSPQAQQALQARLAALASPPQLALSERVYVVGRRPMKIPGGITLQPGETVPGASGWPRLEGYVRTGALKVLT